MELFRGILFALSILCVQEVASEEAKTLCFKQSETSGKMFVGCPVGHTVVIRLNSSIYGSNPYQDCTYTQDTCVDQPEDVNVSQCTDRQNCTITIRRMYSIDCRGYVNFFRVIYECFPDGVPVINNSVMMTTRTVSRTGPVWFGPAVPKRDKDSNSESGSDTGIILAVVGCAIGTLYISIICIVLALLVRRNGIGAKERLSKDEEQPSEMDNSAYKSSPQFKERLPVSSESTSGEETGESSTLRDPNENIVQQGRPGPDGREESTVFEEFHRNEFNVVNERQNTHVTFAPKWNTPENTGGPLDSDTLYPVEQLHGLSQETDYYMPGDNTIASQDLRESSRNVSSC